MDSSPNHKQAIRATVIEKESIVTFQFFALIPIVMVVFLMEKITMDPSSSSRPTSSSVAGAKRSRDKDNQDSFEEEPPGKRFMSPDSARMDETPLTKRKLRSRHKPSGAGTKRASKADDSDFSEGKPPEKRHFLSDSVDADETVTQSDILNEAMDTQETLSPKENMKHLLKAWRDRQLRAGDDDETVFGVYAILVTQLTEEGAISGNLVIQNKPGLTSLPEDLQVNGGLYLTNCPDMATLPKGLQVGRCLYLINCPGITSLPAGLQVGGRIKLNGCPGMVSLPENLQVGGDLHLTNCPGVTSLPAGLRVGGTLYLRDCQSITSLPTDMQLGAGLYLRYCPGVTSLPTGLQVGRELHLTECQGITSLPNDMKVGKDLHLRHCPGLTSLPTDMQVGGDLSLIHCPNITSLPENITQLGPTSDGRTRFVELTESGLSDAVIDALRTAEAPGMRFYFSRAAAEPGRTFDTLQSGIAFWKEIAGDAAPAKAEYPALTAVTLEDDQNLRTFLARLQNTAEYKNTATRELLAARVMRVLNAMEDNEELGTLALAQIHHGLASCDDLIIQVFDELEQQVKMHEAIQALTGDDPEGIAFKKLAKSHLMLKKVRQAANIAKESLTFVDEVELFLAFQIRLKEKLNLPLETSQMIFRNCAGITNEQIDQAGDHILKSYKPEDLEDYLNTITVWQQHLRRQEVSQFLYETMPVADKTDVTGMDIHANCPVSLEKPEQPVVINKTVYDYDSLKNRYINDGKDINNVPMQWSEVRRLLCKK